MDAYSVGGCLLQMLKDRGLVLLLRSWVVVLPLGFSLPKPFYYTSLEVG